MIALSKTGNIFYHCSFSFYFKLVLVAPWLMIEWLKMYPIKIGWFGGNVLIKKKCMHFFSGLSAVIALWNNWVGSALWHHPPLWQEQVSKALYQQRKIIPVYLHSQWWSILGKTNDGKGWHGLKRSFCYLDLFYHSSTMWPYGFKKIPLWIQYSKNQSACSGVKMDEAFWCCSIFNANRSCNWKLNTSFPPALGKYHTWSFPPTFSLISFRSYIFFFHCSQRFKSTSNIKTVPYPTIL